MKCLLILAMIGFRESAPQSDLRCEQVELRRGDVHDTATAADAGETAEAGAS